MKNVIASVLVAGFIGTASMAQAQDGSPEKQSTEIVQQTEKTAIIMDKVPKKVQSAFTTNDYKLADLEGIYEFTEDNEKLYEFIVAKNEEKWAIHFDANGKLVEKKKIDA